MASVEEAIQRLTVQYREEGSSQVAAAQKTLTKGETELAAVQRDRVRASAEVTSAMQKITAAYEQVTRAQQQMAAIERELAMQRQANVAQLNQVNTANVNLGASFHISGLEAVQWVNHAKLAAVAAYALSPAFRGLVSDSAAYVVGSRAVTEGLKLMGPAAVAAGGTMVSALTPALAFVSRIALPIGIVIEGFRAMVAIAALGEQKFKELNDLAANAGKAGVGADFYQRQAEAAKVFTLETNSASTALTKFNEASGQQGALEKRVKELADLGNFANNIGLAAYNRASTVEEKWRATGILITSAMAAGERMAALDLAAKFLPPDMLERLRASSTFMRDMQTTADKIKPTSLISQDDINYATDLKRRLEESERILSEKFAPIQRDLTQLGLNYKESWIVIYEMISAAVTAAVALYNALKAIPEYFAQAGNADWIKAFNKWMEARGMMSDGFTLPGAPRVQLITPTEFKAEQSRSTAIASLATGLRDPSAIIRAGRETTEVMTAVFGDKSIMQAKAEEKAVAAVTGEFERMVNSINRAKAAQEADALTIGQSAGEVQRLRTEFRLTEAAQQDIAKNGGQLSDYADRIKQTSDRAAEAALNFEKAKVASQIKWNDNAMFVSPHELQIAQQLSGIYGNDIPKALASSQAATLRLQMAQKDMLDVARQGATQFTTTLVDGLMNGKKLTESLTTAVDQLSKSTANAAIRDLMNGNLEKAGVEAAVAIGAKLGTLLRDLPTAAKIAIGAVAPITLLGSFSESPEVKALEEAKVAWAGMAEEVCAFLQAAVQEVAASAPPVRKIPQTANDNQPTEQTDDRDQHLAVA